MFSLFGSDRFPRLVLLCLVLLTGLVPERASAQCTYGTANCTSSMANGTSSNFSALSWTLVSGPGCPTGSAYTGNLALAMGNNTSLTVSSTYTVTGNFQITNSGSNSTLTIPAGVTFRVTGNLGDCSNNNVNFVVNGTLIVDGFLSGNNNNSFSGSGTVQAGGLNFGNNTACPAVCNITWDVGTCSATGPGGTAFCTLPVRLSFFDAQVKSNGVHVRWVTESEQDVDVISLEKSSDGATFYSVADFPGQGNSTQRRNYGFRDEHPLIGRSYYRLKEMDLGGNVRYHRIISVEYNGGRMMDIYPVPVTGGVLNLRTNFPITQEARVLISDVMGVVLQESVFRGGEPLRVPVRLEPGIYLVTFTSGDYRTVKRFIVN